MKKVSAILISIFLISSAAFAEKPLGMEEFTSVDQLASAIAGYFPKVQGEVKSVEGDRVVIALGRKDGVVVGVALTLWREGKDILHPTSGAVIGKSEEEIGTVSVTSVEGASSTAAVTRKQKDPKPGDKARITPRKLHLAILPLTAGQPEIVAELGQRLAEAGRFSVLESEKAAAFLKDRKTDDSSLVKEMGNTFGLDAVVTLGIYPTEGKLLTTAKIFHVEDGRLLDTLVAMLALTSRPEPAQAIKPFFTPVQEEQTASPDLPFPARFFTRADFDGDGAVEYAFSDGAKLHIYRQEPAGWKELWTEALRGADAAGVTHISLDAADINANGRPELFATAMRNDKIVSFVYEWQDGVYRRFAEVPGFLRVLIYPGRGPLLIGQDFAPASFYAGQPKEYAWSGGKYVPGAAFPLPAGVDLYGCAFADFGEPRIFLVSLSGDDKLVVYSGDTAVWKSEEEYAGTDVVILRPLTAIEKMTTPPASDPSTVTKARQVRIKGRILALDLDGDKKDEIIVSKQTGSFLIFDINRKGELRGLRWTGVRLDDRWSVREISDSVLDVQAGPTGAGAQVRALVRSSGGLFTKQAERVMMYTAK
jgi:hypothetical protein